ncbi:MAG TPA: glycoside hydrolase family 3 N-terminal domain-containing protein [Chloroflexota bacterium]|nr:glycoside hydrolase family 3 N-terminal domain-containing protein [Chloroflexota bacterium]
MAEGYRDLNGNGRMDPYEDPSRPIDERVDDLLEQMTLEEKAGQMFHPPANTGVGFGPNRGPATRDVVHAAHITHFNVFGIPEPRRMAEWVNDLQRAAEETRLGIPVTISSDPRHAFTNNEATGALAGHFSAWPEPIGLAAMGDAALVEEFADIARQEYIALGIRVALHPMADLATEPRWARINGTFGEDAELSAKLTAAYIRGFQGKTLGPQSVACMTKHFPGGGPQKDGEDAHFAYGREQVYPGNNFDYHLIPFEAAFAAGTSQIMPYYGMPVGLPLEEVGFGFNADVISGLLRGRYGFDGIVCTDWGLLTDKRFGDFAMDARAWGVEHLTVEQRVQKALDAGVDQFGGEQCPEVVAALVRAGKVTEGRIDVSVRRLLREKFRLGLFDNPYLDPDAAERIVGSDRFREAGDRAQRRSVVLLRNAEAAGTRMLPLRGQPRLYVEGFNPEIARSYCEVVASAREADVALLRLAAPYEQRTGDFLERHFHAGDLSFPEEERQRILTILETVPGVVAIELDRPAVIPEIAGESAGLLAFFGASDEAVLDVIFGRAEPEGSLPFTMPSSMESVRRQKEDVPFDVENPLFPFGHGLRYTASEKAAIR